MKKFSLYMFMIGICNVNAMDTPYISYNTKDGGVIKARTADISVTAFENMSSPSLSMMKQLLQAYKDYVQETDILEDDFTEDDAYFALNGVKMQLKKALEEDCVDKEKLVRESLSSLTNIVERKYTYVRGYKYCLAIVCLHFQNMMNSEAKCFFFGPSWEQLDMGKRGLELMSIAAMCKSAGGDDDVDAADYLQYKR